MINRNANYEEITREFVQSLELHISLLLYIKNVGMNIKVFMHVKIVNLKEKQFGSIHLFSLATCLYIINYKLRKNIYLHIIFFIMINISSYNHSFTVMYEMYRNYVK